MRRCAGLGVALLVGVGIGLPGGVMLHRWMGSGERDPVATAGVFQDVMSAIRSSFVDSLTDAELAVRAAKGVVSSLGDPYSSVLSQLEFQSYRNALAGTGSGLGITLMDGLMGVRIAGVVPGSAAAKVGLVPGHHVVAIDGIATAEAGFERLIGQVREAVGSTSLEVRMPGDSVTTVVEIEPATVHVPAVGAVERLTGDIGYIALGSVSNQSSRELQSAITALRSAPLAGLILDLRGNFGGRLDEALEIADLFLAEGLRIGAVTRRQSFPALYLSASPESHPDLPLAILVDRRTASSAEIVAAALQDHGRAALIGERTLGKGLIQTTIPLGDSVALRLSTGRWQRPSGTGIDRGLVPDLAVAPDRAASRLRLLMAGQKELVARHLERAARRVAVDSTPPDSAGVTDGELADLADALREAGVDLPSSGLEPGRAMLDCELRWLGALIRGDADLAARLRRVADPVVAAGFELLVARERQPTTRFTRRSGT